MSCGLRIMLSLGKRGLKTTHLHDLGYGEALVDSKLETLHTRGASSLRCLDSDVDTSSVEAVDQLFGECRSVIDEVSGPKALAAPCFQSEGVHAGITEYSDGIFECFPIMVVEDPAGDHFFAGDPSDCCAGPKLACGRGFDTSGVFRRRRGGKTDFAS